MPSPPSPVYRGRDEMGARPAIAFVPRLLPAPQAAAYLGVEMLLLHYLDVRRVKIGAKRLYDRLSLDVVGDDDIENAKARLAADRAWGTAPETPEARPVLSLMGRTPILWPVRKAVFLRDGRVCQYCGDTDGPFALDHVFPASRGGPSTEDNLVVACVSCNGSKRDKTPEEWKGER